MNTSEYEAINTKMGKKSNRNKTIKLSAHVLNANQFGNIDWKENVAGN